jgi:predicted nucleic acid-binding protein
VIAYLDASAIVKVFIDEDGSDRMRELWASGLPAATSELAVAELACTLAAAARAGRLTDWGPRRAFDTEVAVSERAELVAVDTGVIRSAATLGAKHGLRTLDAVHVSSALVLRDAGPTLVSWDLHQRCAALIEGMPVFPD